jgi:DNA invertase Pin-like site-specific DNA recombinase
MLPDTAASKVTAAHLSRTALLYVRQSSLKQVIHNTESAIRQYDLRGKAVSLGWAADQITVIDIDQGHSGASAADREGFQHLVAEVSLGHAGIVLGLECSRLARNSADWHQLLELCGVTGTLICDEDGLYDPRNFNDRLLLGMKGQLSEAELHFIKARLRGGQLSKARRGELITPLPVGLVYDAARHVVLDPDAAVRGAVARLFTTFEATGSATAVVKAFNSAGLTFPWRHLKGPRKGETDWQPLGHHTVLRVLHNPRYAGCFTYGRHRYQALPGGQGSSHARRLRLPRDHVRLAGGQHRTLTIPAPLPIGDQRRTPAEVTAAIDELPGQHTSGEIADILNQRGMLSGTGEPFHQHIIDHIIRAYRIPTRRHRLRSQGLLTLAETAAAHHVHPHTIKAWRRAGIVSAQRYNDKGEHLYHPPGPDNPPCRPKIGRRPKNP